MDTLPTLLATRSCKGDHGANMVDETSVISNKCFQRSNSFWNMQMDDMECLCTNFGMFMSFLGDSLSPYTPTCLRH